MEEKQQEEDEKSGGIKSDKKVVTEVGEERAKKVTPKSWERIEENK